MQAGDVVTVEPGVYRGGFGGIRVEDLVEVTSDGCRVLTASPEGFSMPAITTNDLKNGITLELDNGLFQVVEFQHVKPGKGGAFVRTKLRNLKTGNVIDRTFNAGVRVEQALLDKKDMQFLYRDGDDYVFMDTESYDQTERRPGRPRRRRRLHGRERGRHHRLLQRRDRHGRDPGLGRARPSPRPSPASRATV